MCVGCCDEYGGLDVEPDHRMMVAVAEIREFYVEHPMGGPIHCVLDDYNLEDEFLHVVLVRPESERTLAKAHLILEMLKPLSLAERAAVVGMAHGDRPIDPINQEGRR